MEHKNLALIKGSFNSITWYNYKKTQKRKHNVKKAGTTSIYYQQ